MKHILLVDDEPHVVRIMKLALERASYRVSTASDGEQALACLAKCEPDVMITDIDMPRMPGDQLCKQIAANMPERRFLIIVLTSRAEVEHREWSEKVANLTFSEKPVSIRRLLSQLEDYFAGIVPEEGQVVG